MTSRKASPTEIDDPRGFTLVVLAYRCVMAELSGTDSKYSVGVWEIMEAATTSSEAEVLFGHFFGFVLALLAVADRPLDWRKTYCAHLCRDEWLAVSMIDAAQRADVARLLAAAAELVGVEELGGSLEAAQRLAAALVQRGLYVCPRVDDAVCDLCPKRILH